MSKKYRKIRRSPGGCPLTPRQWRRLDVVEVVDGIPVQESIDRAGKIKLIGRATSVWVTEYLKRWKADFDSRDVNGSAISPTIKRLVELAWSSGNSVIHNEAKTASGDTN